MSRQMELEDEPFAILIADDVEGNRRLALLMLKRMGYDAQAVGTGREAVEAARRGTFDLVLMDVQMPGMDGFAATRRIIELMGGERPRIVAVTAHAMAGDRDKCLAAGMDDYVAKPITPNALSEVIERARGAASARRPAGSRARQRAETIVLACVAPAAGQAIDWTRIDSLRPYDSDGSLVREVVAAFMLDGPKYFSAMRAAQSSADAGDLASAAHALTGAAANIGARRLEAACRQAESLARANRPFGDTLEAVGRRLDEAMRALAKGA